MGWDYKPYVSVAVRRAQADKAAKKAAKAGHAWSPVTVQGRSIAKTFWGKAWCDNLEAYSDFENRLPRGRTYVRNGSVVDLQIQPGKITARVTGSELYQIVIDITALPKAQWQALVQDCTGSIATLVELLQGKLSQAVMERMCKPQTGMFPAPRQIKMACSCPDWAGMCKHVAATLYGVGTRLDEEPQLLFTLRQVDAGDLLTAQAAVSPPGRKSRPRPGCWPTRRWPMCLAWIWPWRMRRPRQQRISPCLPSAPKRPWWKRPRRQQPGRPP